MKVLVTPRSFGKYNMEEMDDIFKKYNIDNVTNPYGRVLTEDEMIKELSDVDGIIVGIDPLNEKVLSKAKNIKAIAKYGVGVDNIDMEYCKENKISVSRTVGANSNAVADYAFALLISLSRRLVEINNNCKSGDWSKKISLDTHGKKLGVIGLGAIGKGLVKRASGFDMDIYGYDLYEDREFIDKYNINFTSIENIIKECDFISLHLPLTEDTRHIINKDLLKNAKENLIIINTARGGLIDEDALYESIKNKEIYGAGLDVFSHEPPSESKLLELENVIVGSHTAASSIDATKMMSRMATENLIKDLIGE